VGTFRSGITVHWLAPGGRVRHDPRTEDTDSQETHTMSLITAFLASLRRDEEGQGLAEYALILALIAIVAIIALIFLGGQVKTILSTVGDSI
jgi:pilus assembly protein Flp/PilA